MAKTSSVLALLALCAASATAQSSSGFYRNTSSPVSSSTPMGSSLASKTDFRVSVSGSSAGPISSSAAPSSSANQTVTETALTTLFDVVTVTSSRTIDLRSKTSGTASSSLKASSLPASSSLKASSLPASSALETSASVSSTARAQPELYNTTSTATADSVYTSSGLTYELSTVTSTVSGMETVYTTYCPVSTIVPSSSTSATTDVDAGSRENGSYSTCTTTINGVETIYTTFCPETTTTQKVDAKSHEKSGSYSTCTTTINGVETIYTTFCPESTAVTTTETPVVSVSPKETVTTSAGIVYSCSEYTTTEAGITTVQTTWCPVSTITPSTAEAGKVVTTTQIAKPSLSTSEGVVYSCSEFTSTEAGVTTLHSTWCPVTTLEVTTTKTAPVSKAPAVPSASSVGYNSTFITHEGHVSTGNATIMTKTQTRKPEPTKSISTYFEGGADSMKMPLAGLAAALIALAL